MPEKDLCMRCGECCRLKQWDPTHQFLMRTEKACPHLRFASDGLFLCSVYDNRPKKVIMGGVEVDCTDAKKAAKDGLLPPYCPYAKQVPNYQSKVINYVNYDRGYNLNRFGDSMEKSRTPGAKDLTPRKKSLKDQIEEGKRWKLPNSTIRKIIRTSRNASNKSHKEEKQYLVKSINEMYDEINK